MIKRTKQKKEKRDDIVTRFWYTLKFLHPKPIYYLPINFKTKIIQKMILIQV
jgi:hypothetical protein